MQEFDAIFAGALEQQRRGRLADAEKAYLQLLSSTPGHAELHNVIAQINYQRGQTGRAARWMKAALCLMPADMAMWHNFALIQFACGEPHLAGVAAQRAFALEERHPLWCPATEADSEPETRPACWALAIEPGIATGWQRLARSALKRSQGRAALTAARRAAAINGERAKLELHPLAIDPHGAECRIAPATIALDDGEIRIAPYLLRLSRAVVTGDFLAILPTGELLIDGLVPDPADPMQLTRAVEAMGPRHAILRSGRVRQLRHAAVLGGSSNYYHWLIDHLPRMALIEPGEDRILIVNRPISAVQREALGELGFPPDRLLPIEPDECVEVDDLLLPSLMSRSSLLHPEALAWLRRKFLPVAPTATAARIYVSRSKALKRRLLDEDAVIGMLRRHGFAVIHAEDLSFRRQVATFSSAQVIVAPHGAALSNLAFASSGSQVIEIDAEGSRRSFFAILAKMTGAHHQRVSADPIAPSALQDTDLVLGEHGLARLQTALASVCPD